MILSSEIISFACCIVWIWLKAPVMLRKCIRPAFKKFNGIKSIPEAYAFKNVFIYNLFFRDLDISNFDSEGISGACGFFYLKCCGYCDAPLVHFSMYHISSYG